MRYDHKPDYLFRYYHDLKGGFTGNEEREYRERKSSARKNTGKLSQKTGSLDSLYNTSDKVWIL